MKNIILITTFITLSGCSTQNTQLVRLNDIPLAGVLYSNTIILAYDKDIQPISDVSVISQQDGLYITSINGGKDFQKRRFGTRGYMYSTGANQLHLIPGSYDIEFCFSINTGNSYISCRSTIKKNFQLTKGQKIYLSVSYPSSGTWDVAKRQLTPQEFSPLEQDFKKYVLKQ